MILLATGLAAASNYDIAVPCGPAWPVDSLPWNGAVDVPIDAAPAMAFSSAECGSARWTLVLTRTSDGVEIARTDDDEVDDGLVEVFPDDDLEPDTPYTLLVTSDDDSMSLTSFTTGSGVAGEHAGAPAVASVDARYSTLDSTLDVSVVAWAAGEDDAILVFLDEDTPRGGAVLSIEGDVVGNSWSVTGDEVGSTRCVSAVQRDIRGEFVEGLEHCEPVCGCASGSGVATPLLVALGALAAARRRR